MRQLAIYCADVGSINNNRFAWARGEWCDGGENRSSQEEGSSIDDLVRRVSEDLAGGLPVALGFECPLFIPFDDSDPNRLREPRPTETSRNSWSWGIGPQVLVTGLPEVLYVLSKTYQGRDLPAFVEWDRFRTEDRGLLLWEAFISGEAKGATHVADARIGVRAFLRRMPDAVKSDMDMGGDGRHVHSLVGAALLRTRWRQDLEVLETPCLVVKPK